VVSAADPLPGTAVALGGMIAIYGSDFSDRSAGAMNIPLPITLADVQVTLGSELLPLLYVGAGQIDAIVPYDAPLNVPLQLSVSHNGLSSVAESVIVASAQPAVFLQTQINPTQGAVIGPAALAAPSSPVSRGDTIVIYCAGLGPVTPAIVAGAAAPVNALFSTADPVTVTIGGRDATVRFAGLAPGSVAEYQINVIVPTDAPSGDAVPVIIHVVGQTSPAVTIAVK
jgi:uncharacterized protein (TIGR03437 family)